MHKWLKEKLEEKGFEVIVPEMPNPAKPKIEEWVGKLKEVVGNPNGETYLIGHSVGCQGVLRYLETLSEGLKIGGMVLIAPWMHLDKNTIEEEGEEVKEIAKPWMEIPISFENVKSHTDKIVCIFSDNDPYVPLSETELFKKFLDAEIIIEKGKGHFTSSDNVIENEIALNKILEMAG